MQATELNTERRLHGPLYWFFVNSVKRMRSYASKHKIMFSVLAAVVIVWSFALRPLIHPAVLFLRIYSVDIAFFLALIMLIRSVRHRMKWKMWLATIMVVGLLIGTYFLTWSPHEYVTLYLRHKTIDLEHLDIMPETDHERIQPLNSIRVLAKELTTGSEHPSEPFNVRVGDSYRWTIGIEPAFLWSRLRGNVTEIVSAPATTPSPSFSSENRYPVNFSVGENLLLGKNSKVCTVRSFGLTRFLSYEPADVKYLQDDNGEWVQVVSLLKWRGFLFPQPVFGGVQVIKQDKGGFFHWLKTMFVGDGEWISPEEIADHKFLTGQNIVPFKVSRFAASSFKFHKGFLAPMWGYHEGDIRIPDMPGDQNDQPFTTFFRFENPEESKLYHYFALEPFEEDKQGLSLSLLVPADGVGRIKAYDHDQKNEALIGVSAVAGKVKSSRKTYDWAHSHPAENRPYVRTIDGKRRFFWLTTVVTFKGDDISASGDFIAGSTPEVVLTDPIHQAVVWVNSQNPEAWPEELELNLKRVWE